MNNKTVLALIIIAVVIIAGIASITMVSNNSNDTGGGENNGEGDQNARVETLIVGTTMTITDTNIYDYGFSRIMRTVAQEALVTIDVNGGYIPLLATDWETEDSKTWFFDLRNNVTWHDGTPFTADDVVFSYEYQMEKNDQYGVIFSNLDSIEKVDDDTVRITLKSPDYNFLSAVVVADIIPKHIFENVENPYLFNEPEAAIGTGPFIFNSFNPDAGTCTVTVNENYYLGKPNIDTIVFQSYGNMETLIMALKSGQVDVIYNYAKGVDYFQVPALLESEDIDIMISNNLAITNCLWFNNNATPFDNRTMRQAITYAIDFEELREVFTAGYGDLPTAGWVPNGTQYYKETSVLKRNLTLSNQLLDELGYIDIDSDGFRETPDGEDFKPELALRGDNPEHVRVGQVLKRYLNDVGIDVQVNAYDRATFFEMLDFTKGYDMAIYGTTFWGMIMHQGFGTGYVDIDFFGWSMVSDPDFKEIVQSLKVTSDPDERRQLAEELQDWYAGNLSQITLYSIPIIQPYNSRYTGYVNNPYTGIMCHETFFNLHPSG